MNTLISNPKKLFIIDGAGALLSAFLLGVVLVRFQNIFGIPASTLYILAAIPCFFAVYDLYAYFTKKENAKTFLKGIALMNLLYCCLSIGFAFYHLSEITLLGWLYILVEVAIVTILATIEFKVANRL
ncbi:hypothetical protein POV27_07730 [Aureisphaera galaxeae]|uniref:hypothetical protein n=1 Tax=Aureisphaera galaxeae TaxID=1538023 RepID=UPI00234FFAA7|nr:hypothetical protein [Aureisphaera galaxeae]MDC8003938.1 hypothetical protein [Aureisphaera galaxeae]